MNNNYLLIWWSRLRIHVFTWVSAWRYLLVAGLLLSSLVLFTSQLWRFFSCRTVPLLVAAKASLPLEPAGWRQGISVDRLVALLPGDFFSARSSVAQWQGVVPGRSGFKLFTTLDDSLQSRLLKLLARYHPQLGAGVLIDLENGAVRVLGTWRHPDERGGIVPQEVGNLCLSPSFPAASLFKIVTAYGVLCCQGIDRHTTFSLVGRRHTLYRYQLGLGRSRYRWKPERVTLEEAFARSINPVFGRIGIDYFSASKLLLLADKFAFNRPLAFDLPLGCSVVAAPQNDYQRAEIACGFTRTTLVSPLHAVLLAGVAPAGGEIPAPFFIARALNDSGAEIYLHQPQRAPIHLDNQKACRELTALMRATVRYGTAAKSFRYLKRQRFYRQLVLGGKTGSLDMPDGEHRCEWFAGFGRRRTGGKGYAVAVVLVHGEKRTISSGYIASELLAAALRVKQP